MQTVTVPMESLAEIIKLQLEKSGKATLIVTGSSMLPMLRNRRDVVTLIPPQKVKKGDILLFIRESGQYILHRVIAVTETDYVCCGDNQAERESVTGEQIVAVVDGFTRKGKYYTLDRLTYRIYTSIWVNLFFLRPWYIKLRRYLAGIRRRINR